MSDSFLDSLPSLERQKIRKRMRSEAEYERLRESVKGPEDLERELGRSERMAEAHFALESQPHLRGVLKRDLEHAMEQGIDAVKEQGAAVSAELLGALREGNFRMEIGPHPTEHHDTLLAVSEGNVQETLAIHPSLANQWISSLLRSA